MATKELPMRWGKERDEVADGCKAGKDIDRQK
jgi:hypothetical protein